MTKKVKASPIIKKQKPAKVLIRRPLNKADKAVAIRVSDEPDVETNVPLMIRRPL